MNYAHCFRKHEKMFLIITLYPQSESFQTILSKPRFEYLAKYTDYFNIMTYDHYQYSNKELKNGKYYMAPISWVENTINHYIDMKKPNKDTLLSKVLLGIPFHGLMLEKTEKEPKGQVLDSKIYENLLQGLDESQFKWDFVEAEHKIEILNNGKELTILYPTRKFLNERIKLTHKLGLAGVAIWELSQGFEMFMNEF